MSNKMVSLHACEKYAERIMGVTPPEGKVFSDEKIKSIQELIMRILVECHPNALTLGEGTFECKKYDCKLCMQNGIITTIKDYSNKDRKRFYGGIMESGKKIKKLKTSNIGPREKAVKKERPKPWEQDF